MKSDLPVTAVQIQQVAELLGLAVLRWQREAIARDFMIGWLQLHPGKVDRDT